MAAEEKDPQARHPERARFDGKAGTGNDTAGHIQQVARRIGDHRRVQKLELEATGGCRGDFDFKNVSGNFRDATKGEGGRPVVTEVGSIKGRVIHVLTEGEGIGDQAF